jgi:hypothetical protein
MALAVVSEITRRFKAIVAKWQTDTQLNLECRFLLRDGFYVGHVLTWGDYRGVWFSDSGEMKIYRQQMWLVTVPVRLAELEIVSPVHETKLAPTLAEVHSSKSAA